jgi:diguanylate cyclase (GGDEF)-like protein
MREAGLGRDPLTDLFNQRYAVDQIERHLKRYKRHPRPFSLLVVDIHNLSWVDDTYGRSVGDSALGDLADLISKNVREVDVWFLSTRDQFIIVMEETDAQAAQTVAERLTVAVEKATALDRQRAMLEMTFGIASCPEHAIEAEALLRAAGFPLADRSPGSGVSVTS